MFSYFTNLRREKLDASWLTFVLERVVVPRCLQYALRAGSGALLVPGQVVQVPGRGPRPFPLCSSVLQRSLNLQSVQKSSLLTFWLLRAEMWGACYVA